MKQILSSTFSISNLVGYISEHDVSQLRIVELMMNVKELRVREVPWLPRLVTQLKFNVINISPMKMEEMINHEVWAIKRWR